MTARRDEHERLWDAQDKAFFDAVAKKLTTRPKKSSHFPTNPEAELAAGWHPNPSASELDRYTRATNNTVLLIRHLRRQGDVLATLIADVLDGKLKATKKRFTLFNREYLRALIVTAKESLKSGDPEVLALVGLQHVPATKGELSKAAEKLAAKHVGLSPRAFKDRLNPSSKRGKSG